jgi:hypothetical protein
MIDVACNLLMLGLTRFAICGTHLCPPSHAHFRPIESDAKVPLILYKKAKGRFCPCFFGMKNNKIIDKNLISAEKNSIPKVEINIFLDILIL